MCFLNVYVRLNRHVCAQAGTKWHYKVCDTKLCHMGGSVGQKSFCDTNVTWGGGARKVLKKRPVTRDTIYERALMRHLFLQKRGH